MGPFVDQTDGFTAETGLTIAQADVRLKKNEGDWAQKNETTTLVHEENGWYRCLLNSTDTDTLGILMVAVNESGALPVWREFLVVPANVWDSFLGADLLDVNVEQWRGSAPNALVSSRVDASVGAMAADVVTAAAVANGAIDAATFAAGAIDAAAIAADAIGSSELATSAVDEIVNAVWDELTTEGRVASSYGQLFKDNVNATISSRASAASLATVQADTDDIQTRLPAALVGGRMDASVGAMAADVITAAAIAAGAIGPSEAPNLDAAVSSRAATGDAMALTAGAVDAIADEVYEGTLTLRQIIRIVLAACAGKSSGFPSGPAIYRDNADAKDRITATVDPDGNRSIVVLDGT